MKTPCWIIATAVASLALAGCGGEGGDGAADDAVTLRYSNWLSSGALQSAADWFATEAEERSDGSLEFDRRYGAALFAAPDHLEGIASGRADAGLVGAAYHPAELPLTAIASVPFISSDGGAVAAAVEELYESNDAFREEWTRNNLHVLGFHPNSAMATGFKEPVDSLDDFDDVSLRAIGLSAEALAALGAKPIALPAEEVYEALERNTIQAWSGFPFDTASQASLGEIAPYVVDLGIGVFSVAAQPAVNLDTWNSLSDEQKSLLEDVAEDFPAAAIEIATKEETEACEVFKSAGGSVIELSGEDVDQWAKEQHDRLMQSWLDATVEAGVEESVAVEFQEQFMAAVAKYEGQTGYTSGLATCAAG